MIGPPARVKKHRSSIIDHRAFDQAQSCKLQTAVPKVLDYFNAMAPEIAVIGDGVSCLPSETKYRTPTYISTQRNLPIQSNFLSAWCIVRTRGIFLDINYGNF